MVGLEGLNAAQREAVAHGAGPLVVFAGAGSGKTRVITYRIGRLVAEGVQSQRILAVTFTNKAASEMRGRLLSFGLAGVDRVCIGTFHSVCARLLRRYGTEAGVAPDFTIYDDVDQRAMVQRVIRDLGLDEHRYGPREVARAINRAKQEALGPDQYPVRGFFDEVVQRIYGAYDERMLRSRALDFGDLIFRWVQALDAQPKLAEHVAGLFEHVLVDEFQDTNWVQYRFVQQLCTAHRNLCVVGDDDQSIYGWRGADRRKLLEFRAEFPDARVVKLEQNYRSSKRILNAAYAIIAKNLSREPKRLWTDNDEGAPVVVVECLDERDEAAMVVRAVREHQRDGVGLSEMALFYRTHAQSRVFEEALRAADIPYRIIGGLRFYDRAEVKDLLAYLRAIHNLNDDVSLLRIINKPSRRIGKTTVDRVLDLAAERGLGVWEALRSAVDEGLFPGVTSQRLLAFVGLIEGLRRRVSEGVGELAHAVAEQTGYLEMLREEDSPEADVRLENVQEFLGSVMEFAQDSEAGAAESLASFLEAITLQTEAEAAEVSERLTLMTVHAAKGLEFDVVVVSGLEERLFPLRGDDPGDDPDDLEEERRLAYVAITRARRRLILSYAKMRRLYGQTRVGLPSRFLTDLPESDIEWAGRRQRRVGYVPRPRVEYATGPSRPPGDPAPTETYLDVTEGTDFGDMPFERGMRVRHAKFGVGRVRSSAPGMPPLVTVEFQTSGTRRIAATFLVPI